MSLTNSSQSDNHITRPDLFIRDQFRLWPPGRHSPIYRNCSDDVAYIGRFTTHIRYIDPKPLHAVEEFLGSGNDGFQYLRRYHIFVAVNCRGEENVVINTDTQQVIKVHYNSILRNSFPHGEIICFFPIEIGQDALGSGTIGMHYVYPVFISTQYIFINLTKCFWIKSFIKISGSCMNLLFLRRHAAFAIKGHLRIRSLSANIRVTGEGCTFKGSTFKCCLLLKLHPRNYVAPEPLNF